LVKGFIVQGGDPTGTYSQSALSTISVLWLNFVCSLRNTYIAICFAYITGTGGGGESAWGHAFKDEFDSRLQHDKRGVLSMANSGGNTNGSQFFITFQNAPHLDLNHAIFGRVVGGMACLERMESVPSDKHEHPQTEIKLIKANVVVNPIIESDALLLEEISNTIATRIRNQVPTCVDTMATSSSSSSRNLIPISESYDSDNNAISVKANPTQTTSMVVTQRSNSHATENKNTISSSADSKPYIAERKTARKSSSNSGSDADIAAFLRSQGGDSMYTHDSKKRKNNPDEDKFSNW
jgi:cyclophilin family peptidyl-prolyl cis-trans isomerase